MTLHRPQTILTKRLLLRRPHFTDAPAIARLANDPAIAAFTAQIRFPYPPIEAHRFIEAVARPQSDWDPGAFLIMLRSNSGILAGCAGVHFRKETGWTLGYWVGRPFRNKGFATEASRALIEHTFEHFPAGEISITCKSDNTASAKVIRRLGARFIKRGMHFSRMLGRKVPVLEFVLPRDVWDERSQGKDRHVYNPETKHWPLSSS